MADRNKIKSVLAEIIESTPAQRALPFQLGDIVEFKTTFRYYDEWRGVRLKIVEMRLDPQGGQWVSGIEGEQRHRGNGVYDGESTDIDADDLILVERAHSPAASTIERRKGAA